MYSILPLIHIVIIIVGIELYINSVYVITRSDLSPKLKNQQTNKQKKKKKKKKTTKKQPDRQRKKTLTRNTNTNLRS